MTNGPVGRVRRQESDARPAGRACLAGALVACAVLAGCTEKGPASREAHAAADRSGGRSTAVTVTVAAVEARPVERRIAVVGSLQGFERITVTPKVEGRVAVIHYDVGDRLPPEAALLEIDPTDFALAVDEAQRSLEQEVSRLGTTRPPADDYDIEQLPAVERARLILENAQNRYHRQKKLIAQNAVSQEIFEQTENDVQVAAVSLRQARLDARTTLATIRQREAMLASARRRLEDTRVSAPRLPKLPAPNDWPDSPLKQGPLKQGTVPPGSTDFAREVRSPERDSPRSRGAARPPLEFVVAKRMVAVGEMVRAFPSTPVFELVVDDVLKLKTMVPERYLAQVTVGQGVEVRVEAYPGRVFPARVGRVSPTIDPQSRTFEAEAFVPNAGHLLKHGGFAKADVIVQEEAQALTVPLAAITTFAGVSKVFRIRDNSAEEVPVSPGERGPGWVEIAGELRAGETVVTSGQSRLANGTPVVVREAPAHRRTP